MAEMAEAVDLQMCLALLTQIPAITWLGVAFLAIGAFVYWALDCYFLEAVLKRFPVTLELGPESSVTKLVEATCTSLKRRYRSTPWLCSPHLQTVYLHFDPWCPAVKYRREVFTLPDGGSVGLDWSGNQLPMTPTVAIIPGLTSDSSNAYLKYLVADITGRGWRSLIINHRGLGGVSLTSETFYNAGWTEDMRAVLSDLKSRLPSAPLALVGASLGANMVIKFLGEEGSGSQIWGAVAIGCPFDLLVCDRFMNRTHVQRLWNWALAHGLKEFAEIHKEPFAKFVDFTHLQLSRTLREFDDRITRFTANFESVDTYYRRCSSAPYMTAVRTPLLAMSALDDPICTKESIPWDECRLNPYVALATAPRGGHLAIYDGWLPRRLWWTTPCVEFLGGVFEKGFKGLEPVLAVDEDVPAGGLPLVRGVGPEKRTKENGWAAEGCNGLTNVVLEAGTDAQMPVSPSETGPRPNGILTPASIISAKQTPDGIKSSTLQNGLLDSGVPPCQPNGPVDHIRPSETPSRPSEIPGTAGQSGVRPKRVVIEFSDDVQAAAVEAFLSEILDQMRGVASSPRTPKPNHPSSSDAALAASSAAVSASAIAAAAAAVVQSASAAALAVRKPESPPFYGSSGGREVDKAEIRAEYSELKRWYVRLSEQGSKNTWLLAYVAIAVSFPLVGVLLKVRALQRSERVSRLTRRAGLN